MTTQKGIANRFMRKGNSAGTRVTLFIAGAAFTHFTVADFVAAAHGKTNDVPAPPNAAVVAAASTTATTAINAISAGYDTVTDTELRAMPPVDLRWITFTPKS